MSSIYVTTTGFVKKTLAEIKTEYEALFQDTFGSNIDLDSSGAFGQLIGVLSKRDSDLWDALDELYNSRNPELASGINLDNIVAENGIERLPATPTTCLDVYLFGSQGTIITSGSLVKQEGTNIQYSLDSNVTIDRSACRYWSVTINDYVGAFSYQISIDGNTYTGAGTTDISTTLGLIKTAIDITALGYTVTLEGDTLIIENDTDMVCTLVSAKMEEVKFASVGDFTCVTGGANTLPVGTLNTIVTPITNWDEVYNSDAGLTGDDEETDSALRIRRLRNIIRGYATDEALRSNLEIITDVSYAVIYSNRTDSTDGDGRPPHSFEAVVSGGLDQDIGDTIWAVQPAGIQSFGSESVIVTDSFGNIHTIYFNRPENLYIWVKIQKDYNSEEIYPTDGDNQIKDAIIKWSQDTENVTIGKDIIRQKLSTPIYTVPGIGDIIIYLYSDTNPAATPSYAETNITVAFRQIANFDLTRIVVEDIP